MAKKSLADTDAAGLWPNPIVTEIAPLETFYQAEAHHQDYYRLNGNQMYCRVVIDPKLRKFNQEYQSKFKE